MNRYNPLSLSVPDNEVQAWALAEARAVAARSRKAWAAELAAGKATPDSLPPARPLSHWSPEDLNRPPESWASFWHGGRWPYEAYGIPGRWAVATVSREAGSALRLATWRE